MTEKALAVIETTMKALSFTSDEILFIKEKYAPNSTDLEFKEFVALCQIHNANPLKKEVYFIKYGDGANAKSSIVFSYHWLLTRAAGTGIYRGLTDALYADEKGEWHSLWLDPVKMPIACKIGVFTKGADRPTYATVYWKERAKTQAEWKNQPLHMLMKCAAVAALKLVIPDMSGLYIREEMLDDLPAGEWTNGKTIEDAIEAGKAAKEHNEEKKRFKSGDLRDKGDVEVSPADTKRINAMMKDLGVKSRVAAINEILKACDMPTVEKFEQLTADGAKAVIHALTAQLTEIESGDIPPDPEA